MYSSHCPHHDVQFTLYTPWCSLTYCCTPAPQYCLLIADNGGWELISTPPPPPPSGCTQLSSLLSFPVSTLLYQLILNSSESIWPTPFSTGVYQNEESSPEEQRDKEMSLSQFILSLSLKILQVCSCADQGSSQLGTLVAKRCCRGFLEVNRVIQGYKGLYNSGSKTLNSWRYISTKVNILKSKIWKKKLTLSLNIKKTNKE